MVDVVVAVDDSGTTSDGVMVGIPVLANDLLNGFAPNPSQVLIVIDKQPDHGSITNNNGVIEYTPSPGYVGEDTFEYHLISGPSISGAAPDGVVGSNFLGYSYFVESDDPYEVEKFSGDFPPGVAVNAAGTLNAAAMGAGTAGTYSYVLRVTSLVTGLFKDISDSITIDPLVLALGVDGGQYGLLRVNGQTDFSGSYLPTTEYQYMEQLASGRVLLWYTQGHQYTADFGATLSSIVSDLGGSTASRQGAFMDDVMVIPADNFNYRSVNNGASFTAVATGGTNYVSRSARDGSNIVFDSSAANTTPGAKIYTSSDKGLTVTLQGTNGLITCGGGALATFQGLVLCGGTDSATKPAISRAAGYSGFTVTRINEDVGVNVSAICGALVNGQPRFLVGLSNGKVYWTDQDFAVFNLLNVVASDEIKAIIWTGNRFLIGADNTTYAISVEPNMVATARPSTLDQSIYALVAVR